MKRTIIAVLVLAILGGGTLCFLVLGQRENSGTHGVMTLTGYKPNHFNPSPAYTSFIASMKIGTELNFKNYQKTL